MCKFTYITSFTCAGYAIFVWPNLVAFYAIKYKIAESTAEALLTYVTTLALGPIGLYIWASLPKKDNNE